jgi:hypothetical protein
VVRQRAARPRPTVPAQPPTPVVEKLEDARVVLVVGDFLAGGLAEGLQKTFAESPGVRIVDRSSGSSGLVRDDYYNWPAEIEALLDAEKPAVVVLMIGANDGQQMRLPEGREEPLTDAWAREYEKRATAFADMVRGRNLPLLWVGPPSFKLARLSSYMVALNDTFKTISEAKDAEFIDIWDGFVDETGAFMATGPDVNGQQVRLRASDGINMTQAGRQKMAFYVEKPLRRILGDAASPGVAKLDPEEIPDLGPEPQHPADVDRTPPIALDDPDLDGGADLLGGDAPPPAPADKSPRDLLVLDGIAPDPQPGRADAFAATPPPAGGVAATSDETTMAIRP